MSTEDLTELTTLSEALHDASASAQRAWPQVQVSDDLFREHVRRCLLHLQAGRVVNPRIKQLHLADLYLACAVLSGSAEATQVFDTQFLSKLGTHIPARLRTGRWADEIVQEVRIKLLVHHPEQPSKLSSYYGQSPLRGWIPKVVRSTAIDVERRDGAPSSALSASLIARARLVNPDWERALDKAEHQELLRQTLRKTLDQRSAAERVLLDRYFRADHTLAQIATELGEHRSSTKRRLDALLAQLRTDVEAALRTKLPLTESELLSFLRILISQI